MLNAMARGDTVTPDMAPRPFGKIVATHRKRVHLTQEALAEAAGLSRAQTISEIEHDKYFPNIPDAQRIARAFGLTLAELISEWESGRRKRPDDLSRAPSTASDTQDPDQAEETGSAGMTSAVSPPAQGGGAPGKEEQAVSSSPWATNTPGRNALHAYVELEISEDEARDLFHELPDLIRRWRHTREARRQNGTDGGV